MASPVPSACCCPPTLRGSPASPQTARLHTPRTHALSATTPFSHAHKDPSQHPTTIPVYYPLRPLPLERSSAEYTTPKAPFPSLRPFCHSMLPDAILATVSLFASRDEPMPLPPKTQHTSSRQRCHASHRGRTTCVRGNRGRRGHISHIGHTRHRCHRVTEITEHVFLVVVLRPLVVAYLWPRVGLESVLLCCEHVEAIESSSAGTCPLPPHSLLPLAPSSSLPSFPSALAVLPFRVSLTLPRPNVPVPCVRVPLPGLSTATRAMPVRLPMSGGALRRR